MRLHQPIPEEQSNEVSTAELLPVTEGNTRRYEDKLAQHSLGEEMGGGVLYAMGQAGGVSGNDFELASLPEPGSDLEVQLKHLQLLADKETARVAEVIKLWIGGNERH